MPRFSLGQIFVALVAVGIGLSICRLPKGNWVDLPLATLSFYFVLSLGRHAAATRRLLVEQPALPRQQRWGGRLLIAELLGGAMALIVALVFCYLAAAEFVLMWPKDTFLDLVQLPTLPRDLAVLAMLVAIGLQSWRSARAKAPSTRQKLYGGLAAGGTLIVATAYWADRMVIWFLVYLAISGVEMSRPPAWLPQEIDANNVVRIHHFALGSLGGFLLVVGNSLLIGSLVKWWHKPRGRWMLTISLAAGLAAECWCARWIGVHGVRQLSPSFQEALRVPPFAAIIVVATMIVLAVAAFSWRTLAMAAPVDNSSQVPERAWYFHENWLGGLSLGLVAMASAVNTLISEQIASARAPFSTRTIWLTFVYGETLYPGQLICLAAAIGGFALAWLRWRRRRESVCNVLPCIDPALFAVSMSGLSVFLVVSAPILAAASFSCWFVFFRLL
jgi:hypothetical protein